MSIFSFSFVNLLLFFSPHLTSPITHFTSHISHLTLTRTDVPIEVLDRISNIVCQMRQLNTQTLPLFCNPFRTEFVLNDCAGTIISRCSFPNLFINVFFLFLFLISILSPLSFCYTQRRLGSGGVCENGGGITRAYTPAPASVWPIVRQGSVLCKDLCAHTFAKALLFFTGTSRHCSRMQAAEARCIRWLLPGVRSCFCFRG